MESQYLTTRNEAIEKLIAWFQSREIRKIGTLFRKWGGIDIYEDCFLPEETWIFSDYCDFSDYCERREKCDAISAE